MKMMIYHSFPQIFQLYNNYFQLFACVGDSRLGTHLVEKGKRVAIKRLTTKSLPMTWELQTICFGVEQVESEYNTQSCEMKFLFVVVLIPLNILYI